MKKSFILFVDHLESISEISDEQAGILFKSINDYVHERDVKLKGLMKAIFLPFKNSIDRENEKWENIRKLRIKAGQKSGISRRKKANRTKRTSVRSVEQNGTKRTVNVTVNGNVNDNVNVTDNNIIPKGITAKAEYGNTEINKTLEFLKKAIGLSDFKESQKMQRQYANHIKNLKNKLDSSEFIFRLEEILKDNFKAKNSNSIVYLYKELKSFIHSPVIKKSKIANIS